MPKASSFSPLRLVTPVQLVFCLILFFLPWIELQCSMPASMTKNAPKEELDSFKKETGLDPSKPISMYSQSGVQIATGNISVGSDFKKLGEKMKKGGGGGMFEVDPDSSSKKTKDDLKGAPLLFAFPLALLAGMAIAFVPLPAMIRRLLVAGCCMGALGVIGLQVIIGFPLENDLKKQNEQMKAFGGGGGFGPPAAGGGKGGKTDSKADSKSEGDVFRVSWQIPLYLTFLFLLGGTATAFLDGLAGGGGSSRGGRRSPRRDEDDDYEDDDDERPRKKRRGDDQDDDRPRKKKQEQPLSLDDDDEEEERPRKKRRDDEGDRPRKRRDEDDEDDRPRKKKPVEPEFEMPGAPPAPPAAPSGPAGSNPFAFDDDAPPKKKPKRRDDDDDDDDRPRKKRRRDDDD